MGGFRYTLITSMALSEELTKIAQAEGVSLGRLLNIALAEWVQHRKKAGAKRLVSLCNSCSHISWTQVGKKVTPHCTLDKELDGEGCEDFELRSEVQSERGPAEEA